MTTTVTTLFFLFGAFFILVSAIGLVRFPDIYARMHAVTKATSFGLLLLLIGTAIFFNSGAVWVKAILVAVFIYLTAPLASHSIAQSNKKEKEE